MKINIERNSKTALYLQIKNQIKDMIYLKRLPLDYILPSERELAKTLHVNRSTVVKAYEELKAEGLIDSQIGKGTYIVFCDENTLKNKSPSFRKHLFWDEIYSKNSKNNHNDVISRIMDIGNNKIISFAGGIPSPDLFPKSEFQKVQIKLLKDEVENMFLHSPVTGYKELKKEIKNLMLNREVRISTNNIMITSGSQQGLDLIVRAFVNPNDIILVEEPTFFGAIQLFEALGAEIVAVPVDEYGIKVDALEYLINKLKPKFIYSIPNFQNPTGITMSLERRYELISIIEKYGIPIIEDDPYGELRYEGKDLPPLKALDKNDYVIYLSTFSKVISLGLRVGWIVAPERVINKLGSFKQLTDLHVNTLSQYMICEFLKQGCYENHIKKIKKEYTFKRDLMVNELEKNFTEIEFYKPQGGFYLWCKLPNNVDLNLLLKKSIKNKVNYIPGNFFYAKNKEKSNFIRLNFTYPKRKEIVTGIKQLRNSLDEITKKEM
ncbi:PLP-dependent aminotransferase family protein [Clostridium scatologenes]|uniref:Transcriptional regulator, GntR family n=1 Tax=Clostridium scatologenes TaxID=1548 RepID=A0A0E3JMQ3_CLOSL|nr:PLP-dependent aminotransferase family protein [Clostridium scatologenes]AKA68292.1 transcriptional regulator, GntR family [Clostridium scatologenes]